MLQEWPDLRSAAEPVVRTYVFELKDFRNLWAHNRPLKPGDARRAAETGVRLMDQIGRSDEAAELQELLSLQAVEVADPGGAKRAWTPAQRAFLDGLPSETIEAALLAVIEDDDPEQAWMFRSPEGIAAEAERRLLLEHGRLGE